MANDMWRKAECDGWMEVNEGTASQFWNMTTGCDACAAQQPVSELCYT